MPQPMPVGADVPPPLPEWAARPRFLALRLAVALLFLAGLGAALILLAPPPTGPVVRMALPPPFVFPKT